MFHMTNFKWHYSQIKHGKIYVGYPMAWTMWPSKNSPKHFDVEYDKKVNYKFHVVNCCL
jgi:hypothetical protein